MSIALVGQRGIGEAVADHDPALFQVGADHLIDDLGTGGGKQQDFGLRGHFRVVGMQQDLTDAIAYGRTARLARVQHFIGMRTQPIKQQVNLRGLATAFDAFECQEMHGWSRRKIVDQETGKPENRKTRKPEV